MKLGETHIAAADDEDLLPPDLPGQDQTPPALHLGEAVGGLPAHCFCVETQKYEAKKAELSRAISLISNGCD